MFEEIDDIIKPLLIKEHRKASEMRRHGHVLATKLVSEVRQQIPDCSKTLFVFVLRGAMLLYPSFIKEFEDASFCFTYENSVTKLECTDFETVVIVDTLVNSGKTLSNVKKLLQKKVVTKNWILAVAFSNENMKEVLNKNFDKVFCLMYMNSVSVLVDIGAAFTNGDGIDKPKNYLIHGAIL